MPTINARADLNTRTFVVEREERNEATKNAVDDCRRGDYNNFPQIESYVSSHGLNGLTLITTATEEEYASWKKSYEDEKRMGSPT